MATVTQTATTTTTVVVGDNASPIGTHTQLVMDYWSSLHGGLSIGTRRPTAYPEWVTLEVAHGGFATGRALALVREGEMSSSDFMANGGVGLLEEMLETGHYRLEHPENAALLVFVYLMRQGKTDEAKALFDTIAPYLDTLRFYPQRASTALILSSTVAAISTVGGAKTDLVALQQREANAQGQRYRHMRTQRATAEGYAALQGDIIELLLSTVSDRAAFLSAEEGSEAPHLFERPIPMNADDTSPVTVIVAREAELAQRYGHVARHRDARSTTALLLRALQEGEAGGTATTDPSLMPRAARRIREVQRVRGIKGNEAHERYLALVKRSAIPDTRVPDIVNVVLRRMDLNELGPMGYLNSEQEANLTRDIENSEDAVLVANRLATIPTSVKRIVQRAKEAPLAELIEGGVITSAEMIASVLPHMFAAAVGSAITDEKARRIYTLLSVAFARRRSLLLVNLESQVRLEELPWARPLLCQIPTRNEGGSLLGLITGGGPRAFLAVNEASRRQSDAALREAIRCYLTYFPSTMAPNKFVSALKDVLRKGVGNTQGFLVEELAADIFQNAFGRSFESAAFIAAATMQGSVYSRYYGLEKTYAQILKAFGEEVSADEKAKATTECAAATTAANPKADGASSPSVTDCAGGQTPGNGLGAAVSKMASAFLNFISGGSAPSPSALDVTARSGRLNHRINLFNLSTAKMSDWGSPHNGAHYDATQGGRAVEAAMVITTHNLAQLVEMCEGMYDFDFAAAASSAFSDLLDILSNPPTRSNGWSAVLHARKHVGYTWRQILFFISRVGVNATLAEMRETKEVELVEEKEVTKSESPEVNGDEKNGPAAPSRFSARNRCNALSFAGVEAQRTVLAEFRRKVESRAPSQCSSSDVFAVSNAMLAKHFLDPLEALIEDSSMEHSLGEGGSASNGAIVLAYYGWASVKPVH